MIQDLDSLLRQKVADAKELERREEAAKLESIAREKGATLGRLERLGQNEDWQWFLTTYIAPLVADTHRDALDVKLSPEQCNNAKHQHYMGDKILHLLESETDKARNSVIGAQKKS